MILPAVILFWIIFIIGSYVGIKYQQSRNKKLFFKEGNYKTFVWLLSIAIIAPIVFNLLFPSDPLNLDFLKLHSDKIQELESLKADGKYLQYYLGLCISVFSEIHILGLISAFLVFSVWFYYVRNLDFFNQEKIKYTIIISLLGASFSFLTFPLSDAIHGFLRISSSDNTFYNLFVYSFLGIGIVEELVKFVPVLLILYLTDEIDEPIDFIYYACFSALGFALIENLIYFREISGSIVIARALTSAVGHMVDSSIVIYGLVLVYFGKTKNMTITIFGYYLLGAFVHALYDYFLLEGLILFFAAFFILLIQSWMIIINNAMNNSKFFDYSISFKHDKVKFKTAEYLMLILVFNYFMNGLLFGKLQANIEYLFSLGFGSLLILFYVSSISSFDLVQGYWRPVRFRLSEPNDESLPGARGISTLRTIFTANVVRPLNHVGKNIKLHSPRYNPQLLEIFTIGKGKIVDRLRMNYKVKKRIFEDNNWFLVELTQPLEINEEYVKNKILIKIKDTFASFIHDEHIKCWLKLIPKDIDPKINTDISKYLSFGYIMINGEDYKYEFE